MQGLAGICKDKWLVKHQLNRRTTGKINPHIGSTPGHLDNGNYANQRDNRRDDKRYIPFSNKVYTGFSQKFHHGSIPLNAQLFDGALVQEQVKDHFGSNQRGKQVDHDTKTQGYRKSLDRAGTELE